MCKNKYKKPRKGLAVVTGASSGIGRAFAEKLAAGGFSVVLVSRNRDRLGQLAKELHSRYGTRCRVIAADLSREEECRRLIRSLGEEQISVFINNAGFGDCGYFPETSLLKDLNMIDVNVRAVHILTKLMLRKMSAQGGGYLLNVASSAGLMPAGPFMATYYATKSYVASLTRALAEEQRQRKSPVYVGCLCPGPVKTRFDEVANVEFSLKGITPEECAGYALCMMKRRRTCIVPTALMRTAVTLNRFLPVKSSIRIVARQQKKKFIKAGD